MVSGLSWRRTFISLHVAFALLCLLAARRLAAFDHDFDRLVFYRILMSSWGDAIQRWCDVIAQSGSLPSILLITTAVAAWLCRRRQWARLLAWLTLVAGCYALDTGLKAVFHRGRPLNMLDLPGWSFPSGHTLNATAMYGMIAYLLWDRVPPARRWLLAAAAGAAVSVTHTALLIPGYYFPSDVAAGYLIGVAWLAACVRLSKAAQDADSSNTPAPPVAA